MRVHGGRLTGQTSQVTSVDQGPAPERPDELADPHGPVAAPSSGGGESRSSVLVALAANIGVGVAKLAAGLITGSGVLLSEAAHSVGDVSTELLLLTALHRSTRSADRRHPFGYGKERFFWSLLAAVGILVSGAVFSIFEGVYTILSSGDEIRMFWINYVVLAIAAVLEGSSLRKAVKQARSEAGEHDRPVLRQLRRSDDPTVTTIVLEDSAAIAGLVLAGAGVTLHHLTGSAVWDGVASICIGLLLIASSFTLAMTSKDLLIGVQAAPRLLREIEAWLEEQPQVLDVVDMLTMVTGADSILLCARVDFVDRLSAAELEETCIELDTGLRQAFGDLDEVFIEPVPRTNAAMRQRVLSRYGRVMADDPEPAGS